MILSTLCPLTLQFRAASAHFTDVLWPFWPKTNHTMTNHYTGNAANTREAVPYSDHILTIAARISSSSFVPVSTRQLAVGSLSKSPFLSFFSILRVRAFFHMTVRVCHVYCNFKIGFTCRITLIFGTLKDGSLLIDTLASIICFSYRNMFQNGLDALSKIVDAFLSKSSKFYLVWIIR